MNVRNTWSGFVVTGMPANTVRLRITLKAGNSQPALTAFCTVPTGNTVASVVTRRLVPTAGELSRVKYSATVEALDPNDTLLGSPCDFEIDNRRFYRRLPARIRMSWIIGTVGSIMIVAAAVYGLWWTHKWLTANNKGATQTTAARMEAPAESAPTNTVAQAAVTKSVIVDVNRASNNTGQATLVVAETTKPVVPPVPPTVSASQSSNDINAALHKQVAELEAQLRKAGTNIAVTPAVTTTGSGGIKDSVVAVATSGSTINVTQPVRPVWPNDRPPTRRLFIGPKDFGGGDVVTNEISLTGGDDLEIVSDCGMHIGTNLPRLTRLAEDGHETVWNGYRTPRTGFRVAPIDGCTDTITVTVIATNRVMTR